MVPHECQCRHLSSSYIVVYIQMDIYIFVNSAADRSPFTLTGVTRLVLICIYGLQHVIMSVVTCIIVNSLVG